MAYSVFRNLCKTPSTSLLRYEIRKSTSSSMQNAIVRSLWCLCRKPEENHTFASEQQTSVYKNFHPLYKSIHTKGDQELVEFLTEEIAVESKNQKLPSLPKIEGFDIKTEGAQVIMTRKFKDENIVIKFNVNHTVDADQSEAEEPKETDKPDLAELQSKPNFTVEVERGGNTVGFTCSFIENYSAEEAGDQEEYRDIFHIEEIIFHQGEWKENTYSVSGEIIDGYLYDLLMNFLEERGISSGFAEQLSNYSTSYEHKAYISLLENLKAFISGDVPKVVDKKVSSLQK